jgi:endonuclease-3
MNDMAAVARRIENSVKKILPRLINAHGRRDYQCWGKGVDVLVDTILSQNTSNANSDAGFKRLRRRFRSWNQVMNAPTDEVETCIRVSGLSRIKAPRIQAILRQIKAEQNNIDLQFLAGMNDEDACAYLTKFIGVGMKTAACVLLFAFGKALFPVDTHIHRIAIRLGWVPSGASADQTQKILTPRIPPQDRYSMHVLLIEHGRKTCRAASPKCEECVIASLCAYRKSQKDLGGRAESSITRPTRGRSFFSRG